jgi:hypothetical protein
MTGVPFHLIRLVDETSERHLDYQIRGATKLG